MSAAGVAIYVQLHAICALAKFHSILNPRSIAMVTTMRAHKWESVLQVMELIIAIWAAGQLPDSAPPGGSTGRLVSDILGSL